MNQFTYALKTPIETTKVQVVTNISIQIFEYILNTRAKIMVYLKNDKDEIIETKMVDLTGDDFSKWGEDDMYIVDYVLKYLNYI